MVPTDSVSADPEQVITKDFPLHRKWKKVIVDLVKEQVNSIDTPEEWSDLLEDWSWFANPHPWIFVTMDMLVRYPATSAFLLANNYLFDKGLENEKTRHRQVEILAQRFRRALYKLHSVGLVNGVFLGADEAPTVRNSVTIWVAPFAKDKEVERAKNFYKILGGSRKRAMKIDKKTAEDVSEHNRKVKVLAILDKFKENPQFYDHFRCPKNHPEGLKAFRKVHAHWKKRKYVRKCSECDRYLIKVPFKEFMQLKKKALYKQWDLKD